MTENKRLDLYAIKYFVSKLDEVLVEQNKSEKVKQTKPKDKLHISSAVLIHWHAGQLPMGPQVWGPHANLYMMWMACFLNV